MPDTAIALLRRGTSATDPLSAIAIRSICPLERCAFIASDVLSLHGEVLQLSVELPPSAVSNRSAAAFERGTAFADRRAASFERGATIEGVVL